MPPSFKTTSSKNIHRDTVLYKLSLRVNLRTAHETLVLNILLTDSDIAIEKKSVSVDRTISCLLFAGDGKDEEMAAKNLNFPFWRVTSHNDLVAFYNALDMGFM